MPDVSGANAARYVSAWSRSPYYSVFWLIGLSWQKVAPLRAQRTAPDRSAEAPRSEKSEAEPIASDEEPL